MDLFDLVVKITGDTSGLQSSLSSAQSMASSVGSKIGSAFSTIAKVGSIAFGAATTAVSIFGKTAISAGLSFDTAMGEVAATAGKSMEELSAQMGTVDTAYGQFSGTLRDFAKFMGKNTAFSASQAAQALNYMALAGYNTQESMEMLPKVLDMAAAGAMDLGRASDMITDISSAMGLSPAIAEDSERIGLMVDEFAKAAATGNTTVEMLGDAFLTVGGLAKEVNGGFIQMSDGTTAAVDNLQQLEIAFTAMANSGIKGSEAGTHMRNILLKLANPTDAGVAAFEKMGVSIYDANGQMKALNVLFSEMNAGLSKMTQQEKLAAIGNIFNARDTASAEALLAAVAQDWDRIGESIMDAKGSASEMAKTKLNNLQGDITKFKSALEGARITISDGLTPTLRKFVQFGTDAVGKLATAFEEGGMSKAMDVFGTILEDGISKLFDMAGPMLEAGAKLMTALVKGLAKNLPKVYAAVKQIVSKAFDYLVNILPTQMPKVLEGIKSFIQGLIQKIPNLVKVVKELAPVIINTAMDIITTLVKGLGEALPELIPAIVETVMFMVNELLSPENLSHLLDAALGLIEGLVTGIIEAIPKLIDGVVKLITGFCEFLMEPENVARIITAALNLVFTLAQGIIDNIPVILETVPKILNAMFDTFLDVIAHTNWLEVGKQILLGIIQGLYNTLTSLLGAIWDIGKTIINSITDFFGIASPSKLMRDKVGKNIALGLAEGIEEGTNDVTRAMDDMMAEASGEINGDVTARTSDMAVKHSGTIRIEGVNNQGEFIAASEYAIEEIITNIMKREARLA